MRRGRGGMAVRMLAALTACLVVAGAGFATSARATTYTVAVTSDPTSSCPLTSNKCSLRQLINDENALTTAPNPADTIVVPAGTYDLTQGSLLVNQNLTIAGAGAQTTQIDQQTTQFTARVFDIVGNPKVTAHPNVVISGVAMAFGKADSTNGEFGGDVRNRATLTLSEDLIEDGSASGTGGGISNDGGTLTITHSLVWQNNATTVPSAGPPVGGIGGGVENYGDTSVGAGVLNVDNSTIAGNSATELAGGIVNRVLGGTVLLERSQRHHHDHELDDRRQQRRLGRHHRRRSALLERHDLGRQLDRRVQHGDEPDNRRSAGVELRLGGGGRP